MFKLIKYDNANALEATWLRELTPEITTLEVLDEEGNVTEPSKVTPATYEQIASIAYHETQMNLLRADVAKYGGDLTEYESLIAEVEANIQPYIPPVKTLAEQSEEVRVALQSAIDDKAKSFGFSGGNALMLYAGFTNPFQALAQTFATWEATIWVEARAYRDEVIAGNQPMLTPTEAVAMMPVYPV